MENADQKPRMWHKTLPDPLPNQGTVVEVFTREHTIPYGKLYILGQVYSSRKRKRNALLLADIVEMIEKTLMTCKNAEPQKALERALGHANRFIKEERQHSFGSHTLKIHMVAALHVNNTLFASRIGNGVILRNRKKSLAHVTRRPLYSSDPNHHLVFQEIIELPIQPEDVLYLGTPQMYKIGEKLLKHNPQNKVLEAEIDKHQSDLRNLGIITLHYQKHRADNSRKKNSHPKLKTPAARAKDIFTNKAPVAVAVGLGLGLLFLFNALQAQETDIAERQARQSLTQSIVVLEEKTTALIELENYEEASLLLQQIQQKVQKLETEYGETERSRELRDEARYLSSLLPIVEN